MADANLRHDVGTVESFEWVPELDDSGGRLSLSEADERSIVSYAFRVGPVVSSVTLASSEGEGTGDMKLEFTPLVIARLQDARLREVIGQASPALEIRQRLRADAPEAPLALRPTFPIHTNALPWRLTFADCAGPRDASEVGSRGSRAHSRPGRRPPRLDRGSGRADSQSRLPRSTRGWSEWIRDRPVEPAELITAPPGGPSTRALNERFR